MSTVKNSTGGVTHRRQLRDERRRVGERAQRLVGRQIDDVGRRRPIESRIGVEREPRRRARCRSRACPAGSLASHARACRCHRASIDRDTAAAACSGDARKYSQPRASSTPTTSVTSASKRVSSVASPPSRGTRKTCCQPSRSLTHRNARPLSIQRTSSIDVDPRLRLVAEDAPHLAAVARRRAGSRSGSAGGSTAGSRPCPHRSIRAAPGRCRADRPASSSSASSRRLDVDHADAHRGVRRAGLGIRNARDHRIERVGVVDEREDADAGGVELPVRDARPSGLQRKPSRTPSSSSYTQSDVPLIVVSDPSVVSCVTSPSSRRST